MKLSKDYYPPNAIRICIDQRIDGDFSGRIYNSMVSGAMVFHGFSDLLIQADEMFDKAGYPQAFQSKRSFRAGESHYMPHHLRLDIVTSAETILAEEGQETTIDVLVQTRRHTTWQGAVFNKDGTIRGIFGSALELLDYIEV